MLDDSPLIQQCKSSVKISSENWFEAYEFGFNQKNQDIMKKAENARFVLKNWKEFWFFFHGFPIKKNRPTAIFHFSFGTKFVFRILLVVGRLPKYFSGWSFFLIL